MLDMQNEKIAVIDTETNWDNALMSVGVAIADAKKLKPVDGRYFIITPEYMRGGIFFDRLDLFKPVGMLTRNELEKELHIFLSEHGVKRVFAYNARFDRALLPELSEFYWHDIMRIAAYKQFNKSITDAVPCCKTGRMKSNYGAEMILRMLTGSNSYYETHNAMIDALDELTIMRLLGHGMDVYETAAI